MSASTLPTARKDFRVFLTVLKTKIVVAQRGGADLHREQGRGGQIATAGSAAPAQRTAVPGRHVFCWYIRGPGEQGTHTASADSRIPNYFGHSIVSQTHSAEGPKEIDPSIAGASSGMKFALH
jgi:hypothetical protein